MHRFLLKRKRQCDILYMLHWLFFSFEKGVNNLGKNLKGKECGKGICQRKDGWYIARFTDKTCQYGAIPLYNKRCGSFFCGHVNTILL